MDDTAFQVLGGKLADFLVSKFAPPKDTRTALGFETASVAVDPSSFRSPDGFNPARINAWLDVVLDPLAVVDTSDNQAATAAMRARELMESLSISACSTADFDSQAAKDFVGAREKLREDLGGIAEIATAPLDWWDPAKLVEWPQCQLSASSSVTPSPTAAPTGPAMRPPRFWAWRTLATTPPIPAPAPAASPAPHVQLSPAVMASVMTTVMHAAGPRFAAVEAPSPSANFSAARVSLAGRFPIRPIDPRPWPPHPRPVEGTTPVATETLNFSMRYQVVMLSRAAWWSDLILADPNWYLPGQARATMVAAPTDSRIVGLPIAMILTSDVRISGTWSATDRIAAQSSSHLGPWSLEGSAFDIVSSSQTAVLTLPGIRMIGAIYAVLPAIPPRDDPSLPPPALIP